MDISSFVAGMAIVLVSLGIASLAGYVAFGKSASRDGGTEGGAATRKKSS